MDRAATERAIFARAERDAWLNWPLRVASEVARELGVTEDTALAVLRRTVRDQLDPLAEAPADAR